MFTQIRQILRDRRGFTVAQKLMIAVLAVALTAVCGYAFYGYYQSSYQVKASRTAEEAYEAVQDYLNKQRRAGTLEEFNVRARYYGKSLGIELQKEILMENYTGDDFDGFFRRYRNKYEDGEVRYLLMKSETEGEENRRENPLYEMFEYYILDQKNMKDAYLVEYDASEGKVIAVFYSRKAGTFSYGGDREDVTNVILRDKKSLVGKWQGYYGIEAEELL